MYCAQEPTSSNRPTNTLLSFLSIVMPSCAQGRNVPAEWEEGLNELLSEYYLPREFEQGAYLPSSPRDTPQAPPVCLTRRKKQKGGPISFHGHLAMVWRLD